MNSNGVNRRGQGVPEEQMLLTERPINAANIVKPTPNGKLCKPKKNLFIHKFMLFKKNVLALLSHNPTRKQRVKTTKILRFYLTQVIIRECCRYYIF